MLSDEDWELTAVPEGNRGAIARVLPLWPGIKSGRGRPVFATRKTIAEFLNFEDASATKHEYVDGFVYAMAGASEDHVSIALNVAAAFKYQLRGKLCRPYISDMRAAIGADDPDGYDGKYYYPDVFVTCSERDRNSSLVKKDPVIIVEVLSDGTEAVDRTEKLDNYKRISSLEQYWLVHQDKRLIVVHSRAAGGWISRDVSSGDLSIELPSGTIKMSVEQVYEDVLGPAGAHEPNLKT